MKTLLFRILFLAAELLFPEAKNLPSEN